MPRVTWLNYHSVERSSVTGEVVMIIHPNSSNAATENFSVNNKDLKEFISRYSDKHEVVFYNSFDGFVERRPAHSIPKKKSMNYGEYFLVSKELLVSASKQKELL